VDSVLGNSIPVEASLGFYVME